MVVAFQGALELHQGGDHLPLALVVKVHQRPRQRWVELGPCQLLQEEGLARPTDAPEVQDRQCGPLGRADVPLEGLNRLLAVGEVVDCPGAMGEVFGFRSVAVSGLWHARPPLGVADIGGPILKRIRALVSSHSAGIPSGDREVRGRFPAAEVGITMRIQ